MCKSILGRTFAQCPQCQNHLRTISQKRFPVFPPLYFTIPPTTTTSYFPSTLLHLHQLFPVKWCMTALPAKQAPLQGHFSRDPQPRLPTRPSPLCNFSLRGTVSKLPPCSSGSVSETKPVSPSVFLRHLLTLRDLPAAGSALVLPLWSRRGGSAVHRARSETAPAPGSPGSCGTCWPSSGFCTPTKPNSRLTRRGLWGAYLGDPGPVPAVAGNVAAPADLGPTGPFPSQLAGDVNQPQASPLSTAHSFFFDVYLHTGWFCFSVLNPEVHGGHLS